MVPKSICTFWVQVSAINLEPASGSIVTHTKNQNIVLIYESHCVTVPPLPKIWERLCGQIHWRLKWGVRTEKNLPGGFFLPQLSPLLCPCSALLEMDFKQKLLQCLLYVSFGFSLKCLELKAAFCLFVGLGIFYVFLLFPPSSFLYLNLFWNARFCCWSKVNSSFTLCFSKIWAKIGTVQFLEKQILSLPS